MIFSKAPPNKPTATGEAPFILLSVQLYRLVYRSSRDNNRLYNGPACTNDGCDTGCMQRNMAATSKVGTLQGWDIFMNFITQVHCFFFELMPCALEGSDGHSIVCDKQEEAPIGLRRKPCKKPRCKETIITQVHCRKMVHVTFNLALLRCSRSSSRHGWSYNLLSFRRGQLHWFAKGQTQRGRKPNQNTTPNKNKPGASSKKKVCQRETGCFFAVCLRATKVAGGALQSAK